MQKIIKGIHRFQKDVYPQRKKFFEGLVKDQHPEALFITCSDSRINPNLLTGTDPGDLFIIRNAGNIVPPHGPAPGGEAATIEFAVIGLGVKDIIICGHTQCGAMKGLFEPGALESLPAMRAYLNHAEATRRIITENYQHLTGEAHHIATVEANTLVQLENLRTHPAVAARLVRGGLTLHAWVYRLETGSVFAYEPKEQQFLPLGERAPAHGEPLRRI
ncbi:MAG: carbonic anhydrase [Myxococcales bacterium]|nr:carbonic anhydrase [Myxococcales bacterium]